MWGGLVAFGGSGGKCWDAVYALRVSSSSNEAAAAAVRLMR
jgi:hypothetical protein